MLNPEERNRARKKAMRLLEHMDRTEKGLTDKLRQAEFSQEAVEDAIAYVKSYGYINDARYARTYISFRMDYSSSSLSAACVPAASAVSSAGSR